MLTQGFLAAANSSAMLKTGLHRAARARDGDWWKMQGSQVQPIGAHMKGMIRFIGCSVLLLLVGAYATGCESMKSRNDVKAVFGPNDCDCNEEHIVYTAPANLPRRVDFNGTDNCEGGDSKFTWTENGVPKSHTVKDGQSSGGTAVLAGGAELKFNCVRESEKEEDKDGGCKYSYSLN